MVLALFVVLYISWRGMFEPARVKTLLEIRSSTPSRPSTSYSAPQLGGYPRSGAGELCAGVTNAVCKRPLTAPPALQAALLSIGESTVADPVEGEEQADSDDEEMDEIVAKASTLLYQVQNTWAEERRAESEALWRQLEEQYEMASPMDELEAAVAVPLSALAASSTCSGVVDDINCDVDVSVNDQDAAASAESAETEALAQRVTEEAASQFDAVRSLRLRLEGRRAVNESWEAEGTTFTSFEYEHAEEQQLALLRSEVARLRVAAETEPADQGLSTPPLGELEPTKNVNLQLSSALDRWLDEVRLFDETATESLSPTASSSPSVRRPPASPLRSGRLWNLPVPSASHQLARDVYGSNAGMPGTPAAASSSALAQLQLGLDSRGGYPTASMGHEAVAVPAETHQQPKLDGAFDQQLDELLRACDEIDDIRSQLSSRLGRV